jgi:hypothetical protein
MQSLVLYLILMYLGEAHILLLLSVNTKYAVFYWLQQLFQFLFLNFVLSSPLLLCYLSSCPDVWWHSFCVVWLFIIVLRICITQTFWHNGANTGISLPSFLFSTMNSSDKSKVMFCFSDFFCQLVDSFVWVCFASMWLFPFILILIYVKGIRHILIPQKKGSTFSSTGALQLPSQHDRHEPKKWTLLSTRSRLTVYEQNIPSGLHDVLMVYWVRLDYLFSPSSHTHDTGHMKYIVHIKHSSISVTNYINKN